MAIAEWVTIDPTTGSGNNPSVDVTTAEHTGRLQRTTTVTGQATNGPSDTLSIVQEAATEVLTWEASSKTISGAGGAVDITGTTNTNKITFSTGSGTLVFELPTTYTANGNVTTNGEAISGDPGAEAVFTFTISVDFDENATVGELTSSIVATYGDTDKTATINLVQSAGDATFSIEPSTLTFTAAGETKTIAITSNTSWTIS